MLYAYSQLIKCAKFFGGVNINYSTKIWEDYWRPVIFKLFLLALTDPEGMEGSSKWVKIDCTGKALPWLPPQLTGFIFLVLYVRFVLFHLNKTKAYCKSLLNYLWGFFQIQYHDLPLTFFSPLIDIIHRCSHACYCYIDKYTFYFLFLIQPWLMVMDDFQLYVYLNLSERCQT